MNRYVYIFLTLTFIFTGQSFGQDSTSNLMTRHDIESSDRYDDGTCSNSAKYANLCCHSGIRYSCSFLYNQFEAGYCRPSASDRRNSSWRKCTELPSWVKRSSGNEPAKGTYPLMRPTGALPYAADLTDCAGYGRRNSAPQLCAKGVRHALACMMRRRGKNVNNMHFHCGGSAYHYKGCLEKKGFVHDPNACRKPGAVLVYRGITQWRSGSGGDYHGHIEFVGTDGMYHAGASNSLPIDQIFAKGRRTLEKCYVLQPGVY